MQNIARWVESECFEIFYEELELKFVCFFFISRRINLSHTSAFSFINVLLHLNLFYIIPVDDVFLPRFTILKLIKQYFFFVVLAIIQSIYHKILVWSSNCNEKIIAAGKKLIRTN